MMYELTTCFPTTVCKCMHVNNSKITKWGNQSFAKKEEVVNANCIHALASISYIKVYWYVSLFLMRREDKSVPEKIVVCLQMVTCAGMRLQCTVVDLTMSGTRVSLRHSFMKGGCWTREVLPLLKNTYPSHKLRLEGYFI